MHPFCTLKDLSQHGAFGGEIHNKRYFAVLTDGNVYAFENLCPHRQIPLEWQPHRFIDAETGLIRCSSHSALFLPHSGECISGPCTGDSLREVTVEVRGDTVFLADFVF